MQVIQRTPLSSILVVDDHPIIAEACRVVLGDVEDIVAARDVRRGYEAFQEHQPGVVILDLTFPGEALGGVDLLHRISSDAPLARILVFSMHADANIVVSAIKAGAIGYLLKDSSPDELPKAVRQVRSGHRYVDDRIDLRGVHLPDMTEARPAAVLTPREKQALGLLGEGHSEPAIAEGLGITPRAVARLIKRARLKLGIRRTSDLLRRARELADEDESHNRRTN
ncbi:response regulator [Bradyrhizobium sp.]|uniref:response regulator n=1 Tax=Bradyrhizobium sp. TaxID=376 RepID=UPI0039E6A247